MSILETIPNRQYTPILTRELEDLRAENEMLRESLKIKITDQLRLRGALKRALGIASALNNKFRPHHQDSHYSEKLDEISWLLDDTEALPPKPEGESDDLYPM